MKKTAKKNRYCITVASQSDANKRAKSFHATRRGLFSGIISVVLVFALAAGGAVWAASQAAPLIAEKDALAAQASNQAVTLDAYAARVAVLEKAEQYNRIMNAQQTASAASVRAQNEVTGTTQNESEFTASAVTVQTAVEKINAEFMDGIDAQIEVAKLGAPADSVEVLYSGDVEGDSDTVNNWADVLAAFAVQSGYEIGEISTITEQDYALLSDIHDQMNRVVITSRVSTETSAAQSADATESAAAVVTKKLTLCVAVDSLDCVEYAKQLGWSRDSQNQLDKLMSPDYYMTFAALLGVDLYSGLNSEELSEIIAGLEPGKVGTTIVEAALTRVGDPYSRGRRGSGDYVDCSYFAYWAYKQAGITIPTSSVEQAKYCYNNGYIIDQEDLQPGDLLYWSKTTCHCGRWREIHHAGVYIGNGMLIEASSSKGCVVIRPVWSGGEWRLALCARPYQEAAATAEGPAGPEE